MVRALVIERARHGTDGVVAVRQTAVGRSGRRSMRRVTAAAAEQEIFGVGMFSGRFASNWFLRDALPQRGLVVGWALVRSDLHVSIEFLALERESLGSVLHPPGYTKNRPLFVFAPLIFRTTRRPPLVPLSCCGTTCTLTLDPHNLSLHVSWLDANLAQAHLFRIYSRRFTKLSGFSVGLLPANTCLSRRKGCAATDAARKLLQGRSDPRCDRYQCLRRRTVRCGTQCNAEGERTADGNAGRHRMGKKS